MVNDMKIGKACYTALLSWNNIFKKLNLLSTFERHKNRVCFVFLFGSRVNSVALLSWHGGFEKKKKGRKLTVSLQFHSVSSPSPPQTL